MLSNEEGLTLSLLRRVAFISTGDEQFARFCVGALRVSCEVKRRNLENLFAAVSRSLSAGHSCLPLETLAGQEVVNEEGELVGRFPPIEELRAALDGCEALTRVFEGKEIPPLTTPFVLDESERLYLSRYFDHEQVLAESVTSLALAEYPSVAQFDLEEGLGRYFEAPLRGPNRNLQASAARLALTRRLSVITGGPGTGKTSTVVKILALLSEQAQAQAKELPHIALLAPTGKAAARMMEAVGSALDKLNLSDDLKAGLEKNASTIHRALGVLPHNPTRFRRGAQNRLRADVVIVDEASMVDLALMRHLLSALEEGTRLILLGDRYQLASVEAGSVLGELCTVFTSDDGCTVELQKSYRFSEKSGIYDLATSIRGGDASRSMEILRSGRSDLFWFDAKARETAAQVMPQDSEALRRLVVSAYGRALSANDPETGLELFSSFRVLCAHRRGPFGVESMNDLITHWLVRAGKLPGGEDFYRGRLLLITQNDYSVELHNGDVGLCWPNAEGKISVYFPREDNSLRPVSTAQLPEHESAFALTIHKSQGSEYDELLLILPDERSPLLSRELIYTGVTRARTKVHVFSTEAALRSAARKSVARYTGLGAAIEASVLDLKARLKLGTECQ